MQKENKSLNLCEKLAGCPKGTMLWSPLLGDCEFVRLIKVGPKNIIETKHDEIGSVLFNEYGHFFSCLGECMLFPSKDNRDWDNWECPKPKVERFDPKTLQPFDKVLVRDEDDAVWACDLFGHLREGGSYRNVTLSDAWHCCIPYNDDTKHLVGSDQEAPEYYRWWEDKA